MSAPLYTATYIFLVAVLGASSFVNAGQRPVAALSEECPQLCDCSTEGLVNCSSRGLTELPANYPAATLHVDLSGNNISHVRREAFSAAPGLNTINLENCHVKNISPFAFNGLVNISTINLRFNKLNRLSRNAFNGVRGSCGNSAARDCAIDLSFNSVQIIEARAFNNTKGVSVFIGNYDGTLSLLSYAFAGLENGALLSLTNISKIVFRSSLAFRTLKNINTVFIGHSLIPKIKSRQFYGATGIGHIIFQSCSISEIQTKAFTGLTFKVEKYCGENNTDTFHTFDDMVTSGKIEIRDSIIEKMPHKTFEGSNVAGITLFGNEIKEMESGVFRDLQELCYLKLSRNQIPKLSSGIFAGLNDVNVVELLNNNISAIENGAFKHVSNIGRIVVTMKDVPAALTIESNAFRGMKHVGVLHMRYLNARFESFAFGGVTDLGVLNIEHLNERTNITKMPKDTFHGLEVSKLNIQSYGSFKPEKGVFDSIAVDEVKLNFTQLDCECEKEQLKRVLENTAAKHSIQCRPRATAGSVLTMNTEIQDFDFEICEESFEGSSGATVSGSLFTLVMASLLLMFS